MIINDIEKLVGEFKIKVKVFMEIVKKKYPGVYPFETWRSRARQQRLYNNKQKIGKVAKPGTSYHERGLAVDRVFLNSKGQPTWLGDYKYLHTIGLLCGMIPVVGESCHLQDNRQNIVSTMALNSKRYIISKISNDQKLLKSINDCFRKYGYK